MSSGWAQAWRTLLHKSFVTLERYHVLFTMTLFILWAETTPDISTFIHKPLFSFLSSGYSPVHTHFCWSVQPTRTWCHNWGGLLMSFMLLSYLMYQHKIFVFTAAATRVIYHERITAPSLPYTVDNYNTFVLLKTLILILFPAYSQSCSNCYCRCSKYHWGHC